LNSAYWEAVKNDLGTAAFLAFFFYGRTTFFSAAFFAGFLDFTSIDLVSFCFGIDFPLVFLGDGSLGVWTVLGLLLLLTAYYLAFDLAFDFDLDLGFFSYSILPLLFDCFLTDLEAFPPLSLAN
jgi:hypothetical protein